MLQNSTKKQRNDEKKSNIFISTGERFFTDHKLFDNNIKNSTSNNFNTSPKKINEQNLKKIEPINLFKDKNGSLSGNNNSSGIYGINDKISEINTLKELYNANTKDYVDNIIQEEKKNNFNIDSSNSNYTDIMLSKNKYINSKNNRYDIDGKINKNNNINQNLLSDNSKKFKDILNNEYFDKDQQKNHKIIIIRIIILLICLTTIKMKTKIISIKIW